MLPLASILLLTAVTMAQADQMSDLLNLPHHKEHIYLYDVISETSVDDLKAALSNFTIGGVFKILGENRFLFEIISNDTAALRALTFPADSEVTQHPVQHIGEFFDMFGAGEGWEAPDPETSYSDGVFILVERQWEFPETMCPEAFAMEMREWARDHKELYKQGKPRMYPLLASYPLKVLILHQADEFHLQNLVKEWLPETGDYGGAGHIRVKRCVQI